MCIILRFPSNQHQNKLFQISKTRKLKKCFCGSHLKIIGSFFRPFYEHTNSQLFHVPNTNPSTLSRYLPSKVICILNPICWFTSQNTKHYVVFCSWKYKILNPRVPRTILGSRSPGKQRCVCQNGVHVHILGKIHIREPTYQINYSFRKNCF